MSSYHAFFFSFSENGRLQYTHLELDSESRQKKTGKDIEAMNNAISIFDYIIVAIYVGRFKFTK